MSDSPKHTDSPLIVVGLLIALRLMLKRFRRAPQIPLGEVGEEADAHGSSVRDDAHSQPAHPEDGGPGVPNVDKSQRERLTRTWVMVICLVIGEAATLTIVTYNYFNLDSVGDGGFWGLVITAVLSVAIVAIPALTSLGASRLERKEGYEAIVGLALLALSLLLLGTSIRQPSPPNGSQISIYLLTPRANDLVAVQVQFYKSNLELTCEACGPRSPLLVGLADLRGGPTISSVGSYRRKSSRELENYKTVSGAVAGNGQIDRTRTHFIELRGDAPIEILTKASFVTTGATTTLFNAPNVSLPVGTIVANARQATARRWFSPKQFLATEALGSAVGPTFNGDAGFEISRSDPAPTSVTQFFITWTSRPDNLLLQPDGVLTSPAAESTQSIKTILAGAFAGGGALVIVRALITGILGAASLFRGLSWRRRFAVSGVITLLVAFSYVHL